MKDYPVHGFSSNSIPQIILDGQFAPWVPQERPPDSPYSGYSKHAYDIKTGRNATGGGLDKFYDLQTVLDESPDKVVRQIGEDSLVVVDIDSVSNASEISDTLQAANSYAEWSPSGDGIHIFLLDSSIDGWRIDTQLVREGKNVLVLANNSYVTLTGTPVSGFEKPVRELSVSELVE